MNLFEIKDRVVLITGSTQGIGFGLARGFAQIGARVYVNGRNAEKVDRTIEKINSEGLEARAACFDVGQADQIETAIQGIIAESGALDVLINNAGIIIRAPIVELSAEDFEEVIKTDLTAPFLVTNVSSTIRND